MNSTNSPSNNFFEHIAEQVEAHLQKKGETVFFAMFVGDASNPENGTTYWTNADRFTRESISCELQKAVAHLIEQRCNGGKRKPSYRPYTALSPCLSWKAVFSITSDSVTG